MTKPIPGSPIDRLWGRVEKTYGCWLWRGAKDPEGYGRIQVKGRTAYAHRLAWESVNGVIPPGVQLDHQCRVRNCVRPAHLKAVSNKLNSENQGLRTTNKSGYRGVSWIVSRKKWLVQVRHYGKRHHVGYFSSAEEANEAAVRKRNELYLNNPIDRKAA